MVEKGSCVPGLDGGQVDSGQFPTGDGIQHVNSNGSYGWLYVCMGKHSPPSTPAVFSRGYIRPNIGIVTQMNRNCVCRIKHNHVGPPSRHRIRCMYVSVLPGGEGDGCFTSCQKNSIASTPSLSRCQDLFDPYRVMLRSSLRWVTGAPGNYPGEPNSLGAPYPRPIDAQLGRYQYSNTNSKTQVIFHIVMYTFLSISM